MKRVALIMVLCFLLGQSVFWLGCASKSITCGWADESMAIDGATSDWNLLLNYDEKLDASYGVQNDGEHLYVAFVTANPALQRQLLMRGMVLWLNDTGDHTKDIGFKYPRGLVERGMPVRGVLAAFQNRDGAMSDEQVEYTLRHNFRDMQVLDPKGNNIGIYTHKDAQDHEIQFGLALSQGILSYEICVPLENSGRYPWAFTDVEILGIGFETPELERSGMPGRPMGGGMMDAGSGGGGGRGGGRGGMPNGDMPDLAPPSRGGQQPIKLWLAAVLAEN